MVNRNESLINEAKKSKKLPNFIWALVLSMIFMYGGSLIGGFGILPIYLSLSIISYFKSNQELLYLLISLLSFVFISLVVFFRVIKIEKRKLSSIGFYKNNWLKKYAFGFAIGIAMMSLVVLILFLFGCVTVETNDIQPIGGSAILPICIILIGWIIQGGTEEILTRGWLMNVLGARYNVAIGLIISSAFFGLLHLGNDNVSIIAILNITLVGIFFGLYVIKTNDLWAVCGMHSAWNFAQGNLFGFEVSGIDTSVGTLVDLNLVGNNFISGGIFGPEAGFGATIVLLAGIFIIYVLDKKGKFNTY
ncbi:CPBP family intramembrane metalloprotease [Romboutsia weinsteinii]|uniref:CPBP family intramembrane metalloprotease n=1 Tax=Romboutsia weinsteinii TaxID=2020949 RepID=A0A371J189_9FIRM|nr:type II CAAX endopeptidase family protein [Romboutsia weinsteinii]RDY26561.1 CPBP family intramembrane metalloprotease [Romboutsia weinsteinii]